MWNKIVLIGVFFWLSGVYAQENQSSYSTKKIRVTADTIWLEKTSINPSFFKVTTNNKEPLPAINYSVNFEKGYLLLHPQLDSGELTIQYLKYPDFLTKTYQVYSDSLVVSNEALKGALYQTAEKNPKKTTPFDGLNTSGSISRGVTVGNNQNAVLNSNLDLQISGKLSDKVSISASLQDSNIPLQDGGYSQRLDQFDNIFMELYSKDWRVRGGDLFLENRTSQFLNFSKKVQGLSTQFDWGNSEKHTKIEAAVGLVRGQYAKSSFTGQEGNQGPYKLKGNNDEAYVLIVSGSERVYVNGNLLKRGENNDYIMDYNAGELVFTPLFTITSEMRIVVEYQFTNQNYTRIVTYAGGSHDNKNWRFGSYLYAESDLRNQPIQQSLTQEQVVILKNAGNDPSKMNAPSAYEDTYSDNKILYEKKRDNSGAYFEFSTDDQAVLYNVRFTRIGSNQGNYILKNTGAIGKIFEYIAPLNGILQGEYEPSIPLIAPNQIQIATFLGQYNPNEKSSVDFEIGVSNNDQNLFSNLDDNQNKGVAAKINTKQRLFTGKWNVDFLGNYQYIAESFKTVERLFNIEFNRDWNLGTTTAGDQSFFTAGIKGKWNPSYKGKLKGNATYQLEKLDFTNSFSGQKHLIITHLNLSNWSVQNQTSVLKSDNLLSKSDFIRQQTQIRFHKKKNWVGATFRLENNQEKVKSTQAFTPISQRFSEIGGFAGRGDSTKVFVALGYLQRTNDSIQNGMLQRVNHSQTFSLKSRVFQTAKSDLAIFANYRVLEYTSNSAKKEPSLNSRVVYNDRFWKQLLQSTTAYETNSGSIAQQEFTFLEVTAGQGVYAWNDYNGNGIQELQEFEIAPYPDLAKYIRVFLPNQIFIKTHQNKFSQSLIINPNQWQNEKGIKKIASYFYNQSSFIMDRKIKNEGGNFDLNPFGSPKDDVLGLNSVFRNSLFYNRGKQKHSVTYTFLQNKSKNLLSNGSQQNDNASHQLQYQHLYQKSWLLNVFSKTIATSVFSENYAEKNYTITGYQIAPKISYLFSKNASWELFYEFQNKENQHSLAETLQQNRLGTAFSYARNAKFTINGELSFYQNKFEGNAQSAVGFQMLEGLQTGKNLTWRMLLQKNITQFLDINFNYQGRKSETSPAIHTGNVQLRAYF
ncbi:MAG: hypothetical protein ACRC6O_06000 [Flavobacterium sp.]